MDNRLEVVQGAVLGGEGASSIHATWEQAVMLSVKTGRSSMKTGRYPEDCGCALEQLRSDPLREYQGEEEKQKEHGGPQRGR